MKIANKISISFLITAVILTGIAAPIFYIIARRNLEDAIFSHLSTTARLRAHHIETFLETQKNAAAQLSQSVVLKELLSASKQSPDYTQRFDRAMRRLEATEKANEFTYEFFVIDKTGKIAVSSDRNKIGLDKSTDIYFLGARKDPCIKDAYHSETTGENTLAFSAPVADSKTAEFLGVIVARVNLDMLNEITTRETGLGKTGKIYLVNKYGYMITPSRFIKDTFLKLKVDTENTRKCFEDIKKFGSKPHRHVPLAYRDYRGVKVLGIYEHIPQMKWGLLAEIDTSEALAPLAKIKPLFVITMIFVPIAAWLIGVFVSRIISGPIHKLHIGTEIIGEGNLDYRVGTDTKDEIGQLSQAFDKMREDLRESHKQLEEKVKERTAELSSTNVKLEEQIAERSSAQKTLRQHIKQLNCLYGLAKLMEKQKIPLEQIFQETPNLIRSAYRYPDATCVRITFEGIQYKTDNFEKSHLRQYAPINVRGDKAGEIEVYYLGEKAETGRGPFLEGERVLLDAVAEHLGRTAERKRAAETLRLFRNLIDRSNDSIFVIEPGWGRFLDVNDRACESLGYMREELLNKSLKDVEESILDDSTWREYVKKLKRKADLVIEGNYRRKDGTTFCVETSLRLVSQEREGYIIAVARDITERKKTEQKQAELFDEVESINQELKDFAYIVSHDLKAPLRGIKTLADWLVTDYADKLDDNGREQMNLLLSRVQRMHNLIDGVLQYSKVGRVKEEKGKVNLNDLVSEVIDTVAPPENIEITVESELPVIECEETRIIQVFQNLLSNAIKYMDKPRGHIRIGCVEENGFWNFSVADNGPGIEEKHFERIFRIFQTLSSRDEFESTGVGLTVVKKIVELYGGKIWVESKLGEGSTFFFTLPSEERGVKNAKLEANIVS
jgi:PAS domain S-box-containing protein